MKHFISLAIFIVLAIFAWSSITKYYSEDKQLQGKSQRYVELFMNEFEMTNMNDSGKPLYRLKGSSLQRYNDSDDSQILQPVFQLLQTDNQWIVSADSATINDKSETIKLNTNVIMQQQNTEPATTIRTQTLTINTKTQIAKTRALVTITQGNSQLQSNGMIFNNITSQLQLTSSVNGYYLPHD
jgi:lipopolysaccharide export system protein LptC